MHVRSPVVVTHYGQNPDWVPSSLRALNASSPAYRLWLSARLFSPRVLTHGEVPALQNSI